MPWKYSLEVGDEWKAAKCGELPMHELAHKIARKLEALDCFEHDGKLQEIIVAFDCITEHDTEDDFDNIWERLYDWGDHNKTCWIATF